MDRIKLDEANKLLSRIASEFNIENLKFSRDGSCTVRIDDKFDVYIEAAEDTNQIRFFGVVASLEFVSKNNLFQKILIENIPNSVKGPNYFAINADDGELLLCSELDMENLRYEYFVDRLEIFVNYLEISKDKIGNVKTASPSSTDTTSQQNVRSPGSAPLVNGLQNSAPKVNALQGSASKVNALQGLAPKVNALHGSAPKANALQGSAPKANALQGSAPKVNALQGSARKVNALQGSAPKANAPQTSVSKRPALQ